MTDLKARLEALLAADDEGEAAPVSAEIACAEESAGVSAAEKVSPLQARLMALLAADDEREAAPPVSEEIACAEDSAEEELPIYEATPKQIAYWHASGCHVFLLPLLREYELDPYAPNCHAFNHFQIGLDEKRHLVTFALNATHYYAIQFNARNTAPVNKAEAKRVLEKISELRYSRRYFKEFCGVMLEYFDRDLEEAEETEDKNCGIGTTAGMPAPAVFAGRLGIHAEGISGVSVANQSGGNFGDGGAGTAFGRVEVSAEILSAMERR